MNYFQFADDFECYNTEHFTSAFATRAARSSERLTSDDPDPIQPALSDWYAKQMEGKSDDALAAIQMDIVRRAFDGGRRAFIVCRRDQTAAFTRRYEKRNTGLTWKTIATYDDLPRLRPPEEPADAKPQPNLRPGTFRARTAAVMVNGGPGGRGGPGFGPGRRPGPRLPEPPPAAWQVIEITRLPLPAKPASTPSSRPSGPAPHPR